MLRSNRRHEQVKCLTVMLYSRLSTTLLKIESFKIALGPNTFESSDMTFFSTNFIIATAVISLLTLGNPK